MHVSRGVCSEHAVFCERSRMPCFPRLHFCSSCSKAVVIGRGFIDFLSLEEWAVPHSSSSSRGELMRRRRGADARADKAPPKCSIAGVYVEWASVWQRHPELPLLRAPLLLRLGPDFLPPCSPVVQSSAQHTRAAATITLTPDLQTTS
jgi:hypothetical protein